MKAQNKTDNHFHKSLSVNAFRSEADGTRTRNHWIVGSTGTTAYSPFHFFRFIDGESTSPIVIR